MDEVVQAADGHKYWKLTQEYEEAKQQGELQSSAVEVDPNTAAYLFAAIFVALGKSQGTRYNGTLTRTQLNEIAQEKAPLDEWLEDALAPSAPDVLDVHTFAAHMLTPSNWLDEAMASSDRERTMSQIIDQFRLEVPSDEEMFDALKTREVTDLMEGLKSDGTVNAEGHSYLLCRWEVCLL